MTMEIITLGGGCFWCLETIYDQLRGVAKVVSGYAGGHVADPSYEQVCTGTTGHAEVVQITFVPQIIHDPTTLNRQGADVGPQYRSVIFYHSPDQEAIARQTIAELEQAKIWDAPIVTEVTPFDIFYPAEDYHQRYYERNPEQGYCHIVIAPKVAKFRKQFLDRLKS
jgi:peptide-methionine (S)-S-oxide reductase